MPFSMPHEVKQYQPKQSTNGLPIADVIKLGQGLWIAVCPCCGMIHDVTGKAHESTYEPKCIIRRTHPSVYRAWIAKYPEAVDYTRVTLKYRNPHIIPLADAPGAVEKAA